MECFRRLEEQFCAGFCNGGSRRGSEVSGKVSGLARNSLRFVGFGRVTSEVAVTEAPAPTSFRTTAFPDYVFSSRMLSSCGMVGVLEMVSSRMPSLTTTSTICCGAG